MEHEFLHAVMDGYLFSGAPQTVLAAGEYRCGGCARLAASADCQGSAPTRLHITHLPRFLVPMAWLCSCCALLGDVHRGHLDKQAAAEQQAPNPAAFARPDRLPALQRLMAQPLLHKLVQVGWGPSCA